MPGPIQYIDITLRREVQEYVDFRKEELEDWVTCSTYMIFMNNNSFDFDLKVIKKTQNRIDPAFPVWQFNIVLLPSAHSIFYGIFRN